MAAIHIRRTVHACGLDTRTLLISLKIYDWYSAILSSDHWMNSPESEADPETARPAIAAPGLYYQHITIG